MVNSVAKNYLEKLNNSGNELIGYYQHGSATLGYEDEFSDIDILVVWKEAYPNKAKRKELLEQMNIEIIRIDDKDWKGSEYVTIDGVEYNFSHRMDHLFFDTYNRALTGDISEFAIYGLGGFKRGNILYDPKNILKEYQKSLIVTEDLVNNFKENRRNSTINNLHDIEIAAKRGHTIFFIKCLNYLITTFQIQLYLENKMFPVVPKWIDKDAEKFGWESPLLEVVRETRSSVNFTDISSKLQAFSEQLELTNKSQT